jgi:hypothetical protein
MGRIIRCTTCGFPVASDLEARALRKLHKLDRDRWDELVRKRCRCVTERMWSMFTSRPQPADLEWYDKFSR